jgi:phage FluMu protein Com
MSVEFRCSQCGKLLRTDDGAIGRQAQCPECGAVTTVPESSEPSEPSASPFGQQGGENPFGVPPPADSQGAENPYQSPATPTYLPPGPMQGDTAAAAQRVAGPATALIVVSILAIVLQVGATIVNIVGFAAGQGAQHQRIDMFPMWAGGGIHLVSGAFGVIIAVLVLIGAMKMKKLENYPFAMASAIIAMIPCFWPCCILGLPFGIWALIVLGDSSVKAAFRR